MITVPQLGYAISTEEHPPNDCVRHAVRAEDVGFTYALISDHFHPWVDAQGHSPFVWSVIGAIAHATKRLRVGTGVTCPLIRIHPAIIAQAAATSAVMMPRRFFLGLGSGENLNEHVTGARWPLDDERQHMLEEAVANIEVLTRSSASSGRAATSTTVAASTGSRRPGSTRSLTSRRRSRSPLAAQRRLSSRVTSTPI